MLFTISWEQYQKYKETAEPCRQYILSKFPKLCHVVESFGRYFGADRVDIYGDGFKQKSLLLSLVEDYDEINKLAPQSLEDFLDSRLNDFSCSIFNDLAIYVHWPTVIVTNERNQSVIVEDLYAKVPMYSNGVLRGGFKLSRSTYSYIQYSNGYMHSHVPGINYSDPSSFMNPCLGSGPLNETQATLSSPNGEDLWDLFCVELDRYVHVESVAGVPYRYLSSIGTDNASLIICDGYRHSSFLYLNSNDNTKTLFRQFFKYVLMRKKMRFSFSHGIYTSAYSDTQWIIKLSAQFIKFYTMLSSMNKTDVAINRLIDNDVLFNSKLNNGTLYNVSTRRSVGSDYQSFRGRHVLYFKGEDITTWVDDPESYSENTYYVLNPVIALAFLDQCLNYLNIYEHEKNKINQEETEVIDGAVNCNGSSEDSEHQNSGADNSISEKRVAISI